MTIQLDKERHLLFSLNVLDEMQDKFGGYDKLTEALQGPAVFKNVKWLLTRLINEGADPEEEPVTEDQVGKLVSLQNLNVIISTILAAFSIGTTGDEKPEPVDPDDAEDPEEAEGNAKGGEVS